MPLVVDHGSSLFGWVNIGRNYIRMFYYDDIILVKYVITNQRSCIT